MPSIEEKRMLLRTERWEKFRDHYIVNVIQRKINEALQQYAPKLGVSSLTFQVEPDKWSVITMVPIVYYWHGVMEEDEKEMINYVEIIGKVLMNGSPVGPEQKAKYCPKLGFYNLDEIVQAVDCYTGSAPVQTNDEHLITSIMADDSAPPSTLETAAMVDLMASELLQLGYSPRKTKQLATAALSDNPEVSDFDQLVDLALNAEKD